MHRKEKREGFFWSLPGICVWKVVSQKGPSCPFLFLFLPSFSNTQILAFLYPSMRLYAIYLIPYFASLVLLLCFGGSAAVLRNSLQTPSSFLAAPSITTTRPVQVTEPPQQLVGRDDETAKDPKSSVSTSRGKSTTTDDDGETIILNITTIVIAPGPDLNKVYHDGDNYAHQQQQQGQGGSQQPPISDPNKSSDDNQIEHQLAEDQEALHRMITILSIVGGVGAIAVAATILIFTRMRIRKRKLREMELEKATAAANQRNESDDSDDDNAAQETTARSRSLDDHRCGRRHHHYHSAPRRARTVHSPSPSSAESDNNDPVPSAPPAPAFLTSLEQPVYDPFEHRRRIISMASQTAPAPSAPTAKELDAGDGEPSCNIRARDKDETSILCPHCERHHHHHHPAAAAIPMEPPEMPPPAYTPSAPPMYILPPLLPASSSTSSSSQPLLPQRRHSQG